MKKLHDFQENFLLKIGKIGKHGAILMFTWKTSATKIHTQLLAKDKCIIRYTLYIQIILNIVFNYVFFCYLLRFL